MQYLAIREILWAGNSPDMNPIENCFGLMKRALTKKDCSTRELLIEAIQEVWREFQQDYFRALAYSMPKRIALVREADGGSIKY